MPGVLDLADLAAEQWGLVTTSQARSVGVSPQAVARLSNQGALERMTHGVYRVTGAPPSQLDNLRAAWLALDPGRRASERLRDQAPAVVSHRSAAAIHELGDLEADEFEFTSAERKQTRRPDTRIHRGYVDAREWAVVDGLPVTTVIRTVADLVAAHLDGGHLASVVRDALTRRQADDRQLVEVLRQHAHHYNARIGDGEALLSRLLQESGISEPIERAVELAGAQARDELRLRWDAGQSMQMQQLSEQLVSIQRAIAPAARLSEQIANSPGVMAAAETAAMMQSIANSPVMKAAAEIGERVHASAGLQEHAKQYAALVDSSTMKAMADLARSALSPAMQRLAKQFAEVAEVSSLAQTVSEAVVIPEIAMPQIVLGEIEEG